MSEKKTPGKALTKYKREEVRLMSPEERYQIYKEAGFSVPKTHDLTGISKPALYDWVKKYNWAARRALDEFGEKELQEVLSWLIDPSTSMAEIEESNVAEAKICLALSIAKIKKALIDNEVNPREVDRLKNLATSLEKIVNTRIKEKTGGVHNVRVAKYDMAKLTEIRIKHFRETGEWMDEKKVMELANPDNLKNAK